MGQEASVPRNVPDDAAAYHQHQQLPSSSQPKTDVLPPPPLLEGNNVARVHLHAADDQHSVDGNISLLNPPSADATPPTSVMHAERPQSHQQLRQQQPLPQHTTTAQAIGGKTTVFPTRYQNNIPSLPLQQQQQGGSTPATTSIMSRAGLSSMIQRMGGVGSAGTRSMPNSPSRYGSRNIGSSHGIVKQNNIQIQLQQQQAQQDMASRSNSTTNNSIHHQELSPDSKARQQASMLRKQLQEQQRSKQQKNPRAAMVTQQPSSTYNTSTADEGSSKTIVNMLFAEGHKETTSNAITGPATNLSGVNNNDNSGEIAIGTATTLVQGMNNLHLTPSTRSQPRPPSQQNNKSPPSPRAMSLRKMQHNDEEDWEKAWVEDSEDSDEEEDEGVVDADISHKVTATAAITGGELDDSILPIVPDLSIGDTKTSVEGNKLTATLRPPDVDSEDSSVSLSSDIVAPPTLAVQSALTPIDNMQKRDQGNELLPATTKTPPLPIESDEETRLTIEANEALERGDDYGQQYDWDLCNREGSLVEEEDERPCVKMFDPALRVLGRGSFGRVVLVQKQHGQGSGALYAMKILRKSHLVRRRQIERTKTERKVLSMLDHPFIMKMHYAFQTAEKLYLVLDYCPGGELFFHLSRYRRFQEPVARFYAAELLLAIGHLHKNGIIYRDLKPENVLLDAYGHVKLGDFGLAKDGIRHPTQGAKSTCGTPEYMAPEVLNQGGHGFCVDYWGLGMILFEMMTGLPPWYTTDRSKLFRRLRSAPLVFPKEVVFSSQCKSCIAGLLEREPRMRLGVMGLRSAMRHEFFYRWINFEALTARQIDAPIRPCEGWRQLQSRNNSATGGTDTSQLQRSVSGGGGDGGWHDKSLLMESTNMGGITTDALDVATANFDDSFKRMPIETEDYEKQQQAAGHPPISDQELNAQTFRGFTFDGDLPLEHNDEMMNYQHLSGGPPSSSGWDGRR